MPTTETSQAAAERRAASAYKGVQLTAVQLTWTNVGDPAIEAKMIVELDGIGALIAGNYYVEGVTHKVLPGPYTMDVKAHRDGTNAGGATTAGVASAGKTNDGKAPVGAAKDELEAFRVVDNRSGTSDRGHVEYRRKGGGKGDGS